MHPDFPSDVQFTGCSIFLTEASQMAIYQRMLKPSTQAAMQTDHSYGSSTNVLDIKSPWLKMPGLLWLKRPKDSQKTEYGI